MKRCYKCKIEYPATRKYFSSAKQNKDGNREEFGNLLSIHDSGRVETFSGVNRSFGFSLDTEDRLIIKEGI